ncbi:uncharacterized protein LOC117140465 isoform X1 [Drosophila mauritiana]|uniref:Uncharacterized protein LOC117140465 isoform X1 n=1 Tax=Drosophila mauritiana TaxID=7226 RepID=A0A6P8JSY0_DROMA|nr:uncharacterized protein LOC117140465 isoform X1 [Drosophila mauritiana]
MSKVSPVKLAIWISTKTEKVSSGGPSMAAKLLAILLLLVATGVQARRLGHRRLIIHVPVKVKTHHHTHTVYKVLHGSHGGGGGVKQTVYKVLGFSTHGGGIAKGGGGGVGGVGHGGYGSYDMGSMGGMGHGEITYEDMHGCESGKVIPAARDMIFNHYSRHDQSDGTAEDYAEELDDFVDLRDGWL